MKIKLVVASVLSLVVGFSAGALYTSRKTETLDVSPAVALIAPTPVRTSFRASLNKSSKTISATPAVLIQERVKKIQTIKVPVSPAATPTKQQHAQVQTCVWPHLCTEAFVAQVQTCVWPHVCTHSSL